MMKGTICSLLPAGMLLMLQSAAISAEPGHKGPLRTLRAEFSYTVTLEKLPAGAKTLELWLPTPSDDAWQKVESLKVEGVPVFRLTHERRYGNRMVYMKLDAARLPLTVTERFTVNRKEMKVLASAPDPIRSTRKMQPENNPILTAEPNIPVGGRFKTEAEEFTADKTTTVDKAHALYDHIVQTTQYDYKHESPQYAQGDAGFVCDYKKGNCSDLHSYFLSLARSVGIESQLVYGLPIGGVPVPDPLPAEGTITSYHCWVLFRDSQHGWVPLDAADGRRWLDAGNAANKDYDFGNLFVTRSAVMVSRGRNLTLSPAQHAGALNNFIYPYSEVDGKPYRVPTEIHYYLRAN